MALAGKDLNPVERWIANIDGASTIYRQSSMSIGIYQLYRAQKMARRIQNLDSIVAGVEDKQFVTADDQLAGLFELAWAISATPLSHFGHRPATAIHNQNHVSAKVTDVDTMRSLIDRDSHWCVEVRFVST